MQTQNQIRQMLEAFELAPQRRYGQNFLIDQNLMERFLNVAKVQPDQTVLEVGPGTGSLTEELLARAGRVVAVEIDKGFCRLLSQTLADNPKLLLIHRDILQGKHALAPEVLEALGERAALVSNLPYNVATPLVAQCLISSWQSIQSPPLKPCVRFDSLTFTVQQEVADRMIAGHEDAEYGPVSVIIQLLGNAKFGPAVPNTAFWPKPQVTSRVVRIEFDQDRAAKLLDANVLKRVLSMIFTQRRKQIGSVARSKNAIVEADEFLLALDAVGIERSWRAEQVSADGFLALANFLRGRLRPQSSAHDEPPIAD